MSAGEWEFEFEAKNGERIMKWFRVCTTFGELWWCNRDKKFRPFGDGLPEGGSNHSPPIRTFKAFKRFLRKHPELQGQEVHLVNRYIGHSVTANFNRGE